MTNTGTTLTPTSSPGLGQRHVQTVLMFFGFALSYALRTNLSVGIVAMEPPLPGQSKSKFQILKISPMEKGIIMSSFFVGYTFLQIPAGTYARKYGPCLLLAVATAASGLLTILTPLATMHGGWIGLTTMRIFVGLTQGFLYPCVNQHITKWAPPQERSKLFAFAFAGSPFGSICILLTGGYMAGSPFGWPLIFYVSGSLTVIWGIIYGIMGVNTPSDHTYISSQERYYIESNQASLSKEDNIMKTPWKEIWTSIPVWALLITYCTNIWGYWTFLTLTPSFIKGVLKSDVEKNGLLSALPYICMWICALIYSAVADLIINRKILSVQVSRKMWNSICQYGPAICLIVLALVKTNEVQAIALLTVSASLNAAMYVGYLMNPTDLSPNFTGTLIGMANGLSNVGAVLGPFVSSSIVKHENSVEEWRIVFLLAASIFILGSTTFLIFGSSQVQSWNDPKFKHETSLEITRI